MHAFLRILTATWQVLVLMAPYLLLGFGMAGVVFVALPADWVRRHMGGSGLWQVVKAALFGVPLPLCSCGVLPVAFSLRRHGASRGATASFLACTPQTGVDSIAATYALLGPVLAVFRVVAALVSGLLAGSLVAAAYPHDAPEPVKADPLVAGPGRPDPAWQRMLRHAFVTLPRDVSRALLLGILVSGVVTACVPAGFFQGHLASGWAGYGMAMVIGIPLYVCSTASIPLAASLIQLGASPGAAMVFLIAGPATNTATVVAMWRHIGRLGTVFYLLAIAVTSAAAGWALDAGFPGALAAVSPLGERCAACAARGWPGIGAACLLLALLAPGLLPDRG